MGTEQKKQYDGEFKGIVLNKKTSTKEGADGNMVSKTWYTVLYKGQSIKSGDKKLVAFESKSTPGNITIMFLEDKQNVSTPTELSDVISAIS